MPCLEFARPTTAPHIDHSVGMTSRLLSNAGANPAPIGPLWTDGATFATWPVITLGWLGDLVDGAHGRSAAVVDGIHFVYTFVPPLTSVHLGCLATSSDTAAGLVAADTASVASSSDAAGASTDSDAAGHAAPHATRITDASYAAFLSASLTYGIGRKRAAACLARNPPFLTHHLDNYGSIHPSARGMSAGVGRSSNWATVGTKGDSEIAGQWPVERRMWCGAVRLCNLKLSLTQLLRSRGSLRCEI